jgi:hypothetical protein
MLLVLLCYWFVYAIYDLHSASPCFASVGHLFNVVPISCFTHKYIATNACTILNIRLE